MGRISGESERSRARWSNDGKSSRNQGNAEDRIKVKNNDSL